MSSLIQSRKAPFESTASATTPPETYFSVPSSDRVPTFLDDPFGGWQSAFLFVIVVMAFGGCTIFLAFRYAEILRSNSGSGCNNAPLSLEGQHRKRSFNCQQAEEHPHLDTPPIQVPSLENDDRSDTRRRPRVRCVQPTKVAIGEVREGRIAQRRVSSSRSPGQSIDSQDHVAMVYNP